MAVIGRRKTPTKSAGKTVAKPKPAAAAKPKPKPAYLARAAAVAKPVATPAKVPPKAGTAAKPPPATRPATRPVGVVGRAMNSAVPAPKPAPRPPTQAPTAPIPPAPPTAAGPAGWVPGQTLGPTWQLGTTGEGQRNPLPPPVAGSTGAVSPEGTQQNPDGTIPMPDPGRFAAIIRSITPQLLNAYNDTTGTSGYSPAEIADRALQHLTMEVYATGVPWAEAVASAQTMAQPPGYAVTPTPATPVAAMRADSGNAAANQVVENSSAYKAYAAANPTSNAEEYRIRQQAAKGRGADALAGFYKAINLGKTF
jgi:hypothetical protein